MNDVDVVVVGAGHNALVSLPGRRRIDCQGFGRPGGAGRQHDDAWDEAIRGAAAVGDAIGRPVPV